MPGGGASPLSKANASVGWSRYHRGLGSEFTSGSTPIRTFTRAFSLQPWLGLHTALTILLKAEDIPHKHRSREANGHHQSD